MEPYGRLRVVFQSTTKFWCKKVDTPSLFPCECVRLSACVVHCASYNSQVVPEGGQKCFCVTNVCYMPLTFDVSEYLHFQHGHPCSQSKEASETTEAVLVTNNGANSIPLPSVSVQFIHVQPLRNDFVISLPVLKY